MRFNNDSSETMVRLPRLNEESPDVRAPTTHGEKRLSDYKGRWLILFSHPADITPVCTTEFIAFAKAWPRFHGMIMPGASDTSTVRTTFLIDPEGILRAMLFYPMSCGRRIEVILLLLKARQTSDEHKIVTPAKWKPGGDVIVPPPQTVSEAEARVIDSRFKCKDWYFCTRALKDQYASRKC